MLDARATRRWRKSHTARHRAPSAGLHTARDGVRWGNRIAASIGLATWVAALICMPSCAAAEKPLEFTAEHMIEAQMDARYLALPEIPLPGEDQRLRFDIGYMGASGGLLTSSAVMLGLQRFTPMASDQRWSLGVAAFLDLIRFDGSPGDVSIDPIFASGLPFSVPLDVQVLDVSGGASHAGLIVSLARRLSDAWAWQAGLSLEYYDVDAFRVAFRAATPADFEGAVDFAATYNALTPFFTLSHRYPIRSTRFVLSSRVLVAWPQPRQGFHGRISGPNFDIENDSDAIGNGRHIPDGFAGLGFSLESAQRGWRVDVGASLWMPLFEPVVHEGIDPPVFVNLSFPVR